MDSGSTPADLEPPTGALDRLVEAARADVPHVLAARELTRERVGVLSERLNPIPVPENQSVVLFGSWGREELTSESDNDWAVVTRGVHPLIDDVAKVVDVCRAEFEDDEERKPGAQGVFGRAFACEDLTAQIGLEGDSNTNLTRRMLLLLESVEVAGGSHSESHAQILKKYLDHGIKDRWPPRFLLNDLIRYWRTICVDFEGKHWDPNFEREKWVTRNAKLRTARKVLYAGGLLPVLRCHQFREAEISPFLAGQLEATPLDRLASAFLWAGAIDEGGRMFVAYDRWLELIGDESVRRELKAIDPRKRDESRLFNEIRAIGRSIDRGLLALLFETRLAETTRQFTIF